MIEPSKIFDWKAISTTSDGGIFEWKIPNDSPYFDGHFPNLPVFPAVAIIDGTLHAMSLLNPSLTWTGLKSSKFTGPLEPGDQVELDLRFDAKTVNAKWIKTNGEKKEKKAELVLSLV